MSLFLSSSEVGRRIVAISDIHASLDLLLKLLEKVKLDDRDLLVFDGDYINRGPKSLETVRFLMRLIKERGNTVILKGNIERLGEWYLRRGRIEDIIPHLSDHKKNLLIDWANEAGFDHVGYDNLELMRPILAKQFAAEAEFIRDLPFGLETESFIFVHAGIAPEGDWKESSEQTILKNDGYLASGKNPTDKTVIVGHMPVWNLPESGSSNCPLFYPDRRIIGIDGGTGVKSFSQLNALLIEDGHITWEFADDAPTVRARTDWSPSVQNEFLKFSWPNYFLEIVERGEEFSRCRICGSDRVGMVKNEHITLENGKPCFSANSTPLLLECTTGEELYLLDRCGGYCMVKKASGDMGWIPNDRI